MKGLYTFHVPIPIVCAHGAIYRLRDVLREIGAERPLIVTDTALRKAGLVDRTLQILGEHGSDARVFDGVSPNPREEDVLRCLEVYRSTGADSLVALGGGSVIDAAKAVRVVATHPGTITEYDHLGERGTDLRAPLPPMVAVPTTAGTGSEVSRAALIVTRRGEVVRKTLLASYRLVPTAAILDPELTLTCPMPIVSGCAMDAVSHAIEEVSSPREHPVISAVALHALTRLKRALPRLEDEPMGKEVRAELMIAAMMAGMGFEKGLGVVHSISHAIGALVNAHHGLLNAALLPHAIRFNREHFAPDVPLFLATGVGAHAHSDDEAVEELASWVESTVRDLGIPRRLRDLGVPPHREEEIVSLALQDHCHLTNPRPCGPAEMREVFQKAW